jgi:hypothetical protein
VHSFRDLVIWKAGDYIGHLRTTLQEFVVTPDALSIGEDFMLLSSAKFELSPAGREAVEIDVTKRVGIDLLLPVASLLPLEHLVQWQEKIEIPMKVLDTLSDGTVAKVLIGGMSSGVVSKVVAKLPTVGPIAIKAALPALVAAVKMAQSQLRQINEQARERHDYLTATLTQFKLDLDQGETDRLLIRGK